MNKQDWYTKFPRVAAQQWGVADDGFYLIEVTHEAATMLEHIPRERPCLGAEIGVSQAKSSCILMHHRPLLNVVLVDSWVGWREFVEIAKHHLSHFDDDRYQIVDMDSTEAASQFDDGVFDYVFIDASKRPPKYQQDIEAWLPKVKPGGIIAGHDIGRFELDGADHVRAAVDAVALDNNVTPTINERWYSWWWRTPTISK